MNVTTNGYPAFWLNTNPDFAKAERNRKTKRVNPELKCPMNYLYNLKLPPSKYRGHSIKTIDFFINHIDKSCNRRSRRIEMLIEKYSLDIFKYNTRADKDMDDYILLREDFEQMIADIRAIALPNKYINIMSWLINRAFMMTPHVRSNAAKIDSKLDRNRALLMKTLYDVNSEAFLQCWKKEL